MKTKSFLFALIALLCGTLSSTAAELTVKMNSTSRTMTLKSKTTDLPVDVGSPTSNTYVFNADEGEYLLTAYASDGSTVNGTIEITVKGNEPQEFTILTCTAYVSNKHSDNSAWTIENGDYSLDVMVTTREGVQQNITLGKSTTANRYTFLALNGCSYYATFTPSDEHKAENYTEFYRSGTLTFGVNVYGAIPQGDNLTVSVPENAYFEIGMKFSHFIDFTKIDPVKTEIEGNTKKITYFLGQGQIYNYRTGLEGGLTQAGYFTMSADAAGRPTMTFTNSDYEAFSPTAINHSVQSNGGYETGDILVNINPRGHLEMAIGETFNAHAMRSWQLTDNSTNNYFMEPDFHYTIIDLDGNPSTNILEVSQKEGSAWAELKAIGNGTVIVLVTYDAIGLNTYNSNGVKSPYMGGEYWGAIWPENTAAYVVTVGRTPSTAVPNMLINQNYNKETLKLAGANVDAEHDVFYYLDTEEGAHYTFTPSGVANITMAYPVIGDHSATYKGFGTDGVTKNEDGSYTLLLKEGRQIVRLTDADGNSIYQVLTAKPCHREISNATRPGSQIFQPGDKIKIQYSGLRHPANKLAGIYNMSAYVTYNGIPNGSSLILGSGQYTFGSAASAQAVTVEIPADLNVTEKPNISMTDGVIQVNGYGDPIGNHRTIDPVAGRSPNFTAIAHKTYFGLIPDVTIPLMPVKNFDIQFSSNVENAEFNVSFGGKEISAGENGLYNGTYGTYNVTASLPGYRYYDNNFTISDDAEGQQNFDIALVAAPDAWDGKTLTEPEYKDNAYQITTAAELAWFANAVNEKGVNGAKGILHNDIDLGDYPWTPIGISRSKPFGGTFIGGNHHIYGLNVNDPNGQNAGLFGYVNANSSFRAKITGITVHGKVSARSNLGGIAGYVLEFATIDSCANYATVSGTGAAIGGVVGYMGRSTSKVINCYNVATITGTTTVGGIVGYAGLDYDIVENVYNIGTLIGGNNMGAITGGNLLRSNVKNAYATCDYGKTKNYTLVSEEQVRSGALAHMLGAPFGQNLDTDTIPTFNASAVYAVTYTSNISDEEQVIYTNGLLPVPQLSDDYLSATWLTSAEGDNISEVAEDSKLYIFYTAKTKAESVTLNMTEAEAVEGTTVQLTATVLPENTTNATVTWTSSDESIATVDENGLVTAVSAGECIITAATTDGTELTATCTITATPKIYLAESITLDQTEIQALKGTTVQLIATVMPENTTNATVAWTSSDESIATVDENGMVTIHSKGECIITATTTDGTQLSATCTISALDGITEIWADGKRHNVYTLSGVLVMRDATIEDLAKLPKGIYIASRKKFAIK